MQSAEAEGAARSQQMARSGHQAARDTRGSTDTQWTPCLRHPDHALCPIWTPKNSGQGHLIKSENPRTTLLINLQYVSKGLTKNIHQKCKSTLFEHGQYCKFVYNRQQTFAISPELSLVCNLKTRADLAVEKTPLHPSLFLSEFNRSGSV